MIRERALQVVLLVVGLFFVAISVYSLYGELWQAQWLLPTHSEVVPMFASLYITLGVFVLLALKDPFGHRILIAFAAWSSLVHAAVMSVQAVQASAAARRDFLAAVALFAAIGIVLLALSPAQRRAPLPSTAVRA